MRARHATRTVARWFGRNVVSLALLVAVVAIAIVAFNANNTAGRALAARDATGQQAKAAASPVQQVCAEGGTAAKKLEQRGACQKAAKVLATPVVTVSGLPGETGATGRPGRAPTSAEVLKAVTTYCQFHDCRGPKGDGPSSADVAAAVKEFCDARGECRGPVGPTGVPGPGPSDDQVAAAVAAYCADHDQCRGPKGDTVTGDPGKDGADGHPPAGWTFTGPDGTDYNCTPDGPTGPGDKPHYTCRATNTPTPTPTVP